MGVVDESVSSVESASYLIRQLGEAYVKLEAHKDALPSKDKLLWKDIESHFHQMESVLKKKHEDLKAKEEEFTKKEAEIRRAIAEREAAVVTKEQDLLDRVQDLKDAAVAAIVEARANHVAEPAAPAIVTNGNDNKVSSSLDAENAPLCVPDEGHPHDVGENAEALDVKAKRYSALIRSCELMDANGLLNLITENQNHLSDVCSELSVALSSATEPARLVLESLEGIFPSAKNTNKGKFTKQGVNCNEALKGLHQSCWVVTEAWAAMLAKAGPLADYFLSHEIIGQAKAIADEWMPKLSAVEGNDAPSGNENSLEIGGFLWLLATFRIGSEFDQDELCKLVLAVAHRHREATELCLSLGLTDKMPGIIEALIDSGKLSDAVHLIQAFQLSDTYPPVPLLKEYLKVVRRNSQGKGSRGDASSQMINNTRELTALEAVVKCIKDYNLQDEYPLFQLEGRIAQLLRSKAMDPKRIRGEKKYNPPNLQVHIHHQPKKAKLNGGYRGHHTHGFSGRTGSITTTRQTQVPYLTERASAYAETPPERHPHLTAIAYGYSVSNQPSYSAPEPQQRFAHATSSTYSYPAASQTGYAAPPAGEQKSYYYVLDHTTNSAGYGSGAPVYTTHTGSGAPGYVSHTGSGAPGYVSHTGSGANTSYSHQSYM